MTNEIVLNIKKLKLSYKVETTEHKYNFTEETIIKYSIFKGRELTSALLELIQEEESKNSLMNKAINYLSYQARSVNEVKKYLIDKDCSEEIAEVIIQKIIHLGYLDDEKFANSLLDYTVRTNKGPRVLEEKLIQKELEDDLMKSTILKYTEELEEEVLQQLIENILPRYKSSPKKKQKVLIFQKLMRDGFRSELIHNYLNKIEFVDESRDELEKAIKKELAKYDQLDYKLKSKLISKLMNKGYEYASIMECLDNLE